MSYQLSFLSNAPNSKISNQQQTASGLREIKLCTTEQAAILLNISTSTLNRARRASQAYRGKKTHWIAVPTTERNTWQVIL
jgi:hypothetical protein